jgi:hypothetical protein
MLWADLLLPWQLVAVRSECVTKGISGSAASRILMTRTTGLSRRRGIRRQRDRAFGSADRQQSADCQRRNSDSQESRIHLLSPLMKPF